MVRSIGALLLRTAAAAWASAPCALRSPSLRETALGTPPRGHSLAARTAATRRRAPGVSRLLTRECLVPCVFLRQGLFTKLLYGPGEECTSNGLYCFTGIPGEDAFSVFDVNADDAWSSLYTVDTRYGGGQGVAGKLCCSRVVALVRSAARYASRRGTDGGLWA